MEVRDQFEIARKHLEPQDLRVWETKHVYGYGRVRGAWVLGLSESAYRYRLARAELVMKPLLQREEAA